MRRTSTTFRFGRLVGISLPLLITATQALAGDKYQESETAVFSDVQPDHALLYVVRDRHVKFLSSRFKVFVDTTPLGYLRGMCYLTAQVEPGVRLLWGPDENVPQWLTLEAGKTYAVRLGENWTTNFVRVSGQMQAQPHLVSTFWETLDPGVLENLVNTKKLTCVSLTDEGARDLRESGAKGIAKARGKAGITRVAFPAGGGAPTSGAAPMSGAAPAPVPESSREDALRQGAVAAPAAAPAPLLPLTFEPVWYRPEKRGVFAAVTKAYKLKGTLTITQENVELASGDESVTIEVRDIRSIGSGFMPNDVANNWLIVEYGKPGSVQRAGFMPAPSTRAGGSTIQAIADALRTAREGSQIAPMERVVRVVETAESFERDGALHSGSFNTYMAARGDADSIREQLHAIDPILAAHLEQHPDDLGALFLQVRMDRALDILTPVVITGGKVQPADSLGPKRDPQATLDTILRLSPDNPRALYMKARLYGVTRSPLEGAGGLDKAIQFSRQAVQADPGNLEYREALALYLFESEKESEAMEVLKDVAGGRHPIRRLLADRSVLPIPDGAVAQKEFASGLAEMEMGAGRMKDNPLLRVSAYALPGTASQVETFYKKLWKDFRLYDLESAEKEESAGRDLTAEFGWHGDDPVPIGRKPNMRKQPSGSSLILFVFEVADPPPDVRGRMHMPPSGPIIQIVIYNWRDVSGLKP